MASGGDGDDRFRFIPIGSQYDPVRDDEAAALGHALLAQLRGEPLSPFERGPDAEVRVSWRSYKGSSPFLDVRRWERVHGDGMRPTRQGVSIRLRELSRLMTVLVQALQRAGVTAPGVAEERPRDEEDV